jgi:hypothetical protein
MPKFKPSFSIPKQNFEYFDKKRYDDFVFPTYRELKSKLKSIMIEHGCNEVCVSRSKRGEFGEYYEKWFLTGDGHLYKSGEGWM